MQKQVLARLGLLVLGSLAMSCAPSDSGPSVPDGTGGKTVGTGTGGVGATGVTGGTGGFGTTGATGASGGTGGTGGLGATGGTGGTETTSSTPDANQPKGFAKVADQLNPGSASSVPVPLIVLGGLALLLVAAGGAGLVAKRVQSRRTGQ